MMSCSSVGYVRRIYKQLIGVLLTAEITFTVGMNTQKL
jgi:hypothetical protein